MMYLRSIVSLCVLFVLCASVQAAEVIRLYEGPPPGTEDWDHEEREYFSPIFGNNVVTNVTTPTLTAFLPEEPNGTAVIVAPGGGFHALSIDSEGTDVAKWLSERGVTAFVLRYRLFPTGEDGVRDLMAKAAKREKVQEDMAAVAPFAGADGLAAIRYVRENVAKYNLSPDRIGFMGFSAGGAVTAFVAFNGEEAGRPDFVAPVYAAIGMIENLEMPKNAPPMFLVAATDDPLGLAKDSIELYSMWLEAKRPVELHMYAKGGHGFGMKKQNLPSDTWIDRFGEWLGAMGYLEASRN